MPWGIIGIDGGYFLTKFFWFTTLTSLTIIACVLILTSKKGDW